MSKVQGRHLLHDQQRLFHLHRHNKLSDMRAQSRGCGRRVRQLGAALLSNFWQTAGCVGSRLTSQAKRGSAQLTIGGILRMRD
jgi:hypothetical protein